MSDKSTTVNGSGGELQSRWTRWVPALGWLPQYRAEYLRADVIAGITLSAYLMPAGLADASLAGLPPEAGLYACLFSALVFWLLGYALVRVDRLVLLRPTQLACLGMVLGPLLWATRNGAGVFVRPAMWGFALTLIARCVGDSLARRRCQPIPVEPRLRPTTNM